MNSLIMNLTDCDGFSDSRVIPQQVKTCSGVYVAHGEYGYELGEINFGSDSDSDSEVQIETNMEEKAMLQHTAVSSLQVHIISQTLHCSDRMRSYADSSGCSAGRGIRIRPRSQNNARMYLIVLSMHVV